MIYRIVITKYHTNKQDVLCGEEIHAMKSGKNE